MKNKNNWLLILPLIVFVGTFFIIRTLDNRSYAIDSPDEQEYKKFSSGTLFDIVKKNTFSWHTVGLNASSGSTTSTPITINGAIFFPVDGVTAGNTVGTWYMKLSSGDYTSVAYKATLESTLDQGHPRKRYTLTGSNHTSLVSSTNQAKFVKVMPYMYPYINLGASSSDSGTLKYFLKDSTLGIGSKYSQYSFDDLNVNEVVAATQAAIWAINTGNKNFKYSSTLTSLSGFSSCSDYYSGKILTSEEKKWYAANQCSTDGNFYKYVFNHTKDSNTENRINTLIDWYVNNLEGKVNNSSTGNEKFELDENNTSFNSEGLTAKFIVENMPTYHILFKNESNNVVYETDNLENDIYTISADKLVGVDVIKVEVISTTATPHLIYYYSCSGRTDFIGLENTFYSETLNLKIKREEEEVLGKIMLYKIGDNSGNVNISNSQTGVFDATKCEGNCLNDARFELYYKNKTNLYKEFETDYSDNNGIVINELPLGTYYLKEIVPPAGHTLYNFNVSPVDSNGFIEINLTADNATNGVDVIVNNPNSDSVCFSKIVAGDLSQKLSGATFIIQDLDGNIVQDTSGQPIGVFTTTDDESVVCFDGNKHPRLDTGAYFLQEVSAPAGYTVSPNRYLFHVGNNNVTPNQDEVGTYVNAPAKDSNGVINIPNVKGLSFTKTSGLNGDCLSGADMTLKDKDGKELTSWTSSCTKDGDEAGYNIPICLEGNSSSEFCVTPGTYTLSETMPPKGYATAEDQEITIGTDGKITGNTNVEDPPIEVCIYSVKKGTYELLEGAEIEVYEPQICIDDGDSENFGRECDPKVFIPKFRSTTSEDATCFYATFGPGDYDVKQITPPEGYTPVDPDITITVEDKTGRQNFYIENEMDAPKTSIDYSITAIIIASVFMMFGIGLVGYYEYKKQH